MKETQKPFDRREAASLIAPMLQLGLDPTLAIKASIEVAQEFDAACKAAKPGKQLKESIRADRRFGQFAPHGEDLYFLTNDAVHILVCSFPTVEMCALGSLALNGYLRSAESIGAVPTPKDSFPANASTINLEEDK